VGQFEVFAGSVSKCEQSRYLESSTVQVLCGSIGGSGKMAPQLCEKCKQTHPGRVCDYDEQGECAETIGVNEVTQPRSEPSKDEED
jgi:hypothetical protein